MSENTNISARLISQDLQQFFTGEGFVAIDPPVLQPAEPFINLSGEDIKRRLFLLSDLSGDEICLRPDFTIPVALDFLSSENLNVGDTGPNHRYCYSGKAFRRGKEDTYSPDEFYQAGIEIYNAPELEADEEVLFLCLAGIEKLGLEGVEVRVGYPAIFDRLICALGVTENWRRQLRRHFARHDILETLKVADKKQRNFARSTIGETLSKLDPDSATKLIKDMLNLTGNLDNAGRTAEEIASRFMRQTADENSLPDQKVLEQIVAFLEIKGGLEKAVQDILSICHNSGISSELVLGEALNFCTKLRTSKRIQTAFDSEITFETEFGRSLEYYSGFVFEIYDPFNRELGPLAGGGRYDNLLFNLGAEKDIPAVGCAVHVDRVLAAQGLRVGQ